MNREEVLEKIRLQKKDEREEFVRDKSVKWALITMAILSGIFAFVRAENNLPMMDLPVIVCGSASVAFMYRFTKTKVKSDLVCSIITVCVAIIALIRFCQRY